MPFQKFSFSNCNAIVKVNAPLWWSHQERDDGLGEQENEAEGCPVEIKWKNLNTGEQKWYEISTESAMASACSFDDGNYWVSLSPSGRYIVLWYSYVDDPEGNLCILAIDTKTQKLTEGTAKEFGEFIDRSSDKPYHGSCMLRILDNGLIHVVTVSECYENYLMCPKTNEVVLNLEELLDGLIDEDNYYSVSIATPESLLLLSGQFDLNKNGSANYRVFKYSLETKLGYIKKMSTETLRDLADKYTMMPNLL